LPILAPKGRSVSISRETRVAPHCRDKVQPVPMRQSRAGSKSLMPWSQKTWV
jgi:hypothetical protein